MNADAEPCRSCGTPDLQCDLENFCCFNCNHPWPALDALTRRSSVPARTIQQRSRGDLNAALTKPGPVDFLPIVKETPDWSRTMRQGWPDHESANAGAAKPMHHKDTAQRVSAIVPEDNLDVRSVEIGKEQVSALRDMLVAAIEWESEDRYAAGWAHGIESELWLEGGKWRVVGELVGWPSGFEAPWITAAEADRKFGPLSEFLG